MPRFQPGQSGNPKGRKPGSGRVAEIRRLLVPHKGPLVAKAVELALAGDTTALRLCLERMLPPLKSTHAPVTVPGLASAETPGQKAEAILRALERGRISVDQAQALSAVLANVAAVDLEDRLARLEEQMDAPQ